MSSTVASSPSSSPSPSPSLSPSAALPYTAIPGPRGLPGLGVALDYARAPLELLLRLRGEYGPGPMKLRIARLEFTFINEPELIERVLLTESRDYKKDRYGQRLGKEFLGQGLLTSDGDFWRRQRRLSQPAFHKERIAGYGEVMVDAAQRYAAQRTGRVRRELQAEMMRLTLDIVARTLFSSSDAQADAVGKAMDVVMHRYSNALTMVFPLLGRLPLPSNLRFEKAKRSLDEIVYGFIEKRRRLGSDDPGRDLLGMLLSARDEDGGAMSDLQLRDELITLFLAGHETTALLLSYTFILLSQHPDVLSRLRAELRAVLGDRAPTVADVPKLRYCESVILESMRIYPPAWITGREAVRDVELGGYCLPQGTQVAMSTWVMHRDPRFFDEPLRFRPERWEGGLEKRLPRYVYFPFGGGPRLCIGREFAMLEAMLCLAVLVSRFQITVEAPEKLRFLPSVTLRPRDPVMAEFAPL